ncbi:MAG: ECF transporter S component, partial [Anaerovoracaceae bacterium]
PITLVVKAAMAISVGLFVQWALKGGLSAMKLCIMEIIGMIIGGAIMCAGYYLAEGFMVGNWVAPLAAIPMNIIQFVVGVFLATILVNALYKTPARKMFAYHLDTVQ